MPPVAAVFMSPARQTPTKAMAANAIGKANLAPKAPAIRRFGQSCRRVVSIRWRLEAIDSPPVLIASGQRTALLQVTDIGRDRFDLGLVQAVGDRLHDRRVIRVLRILAALLVPIRQFARNIIGELAGQPRKRAVTLAVRAVAGGARRHIAGWNSFLEDLFAGGDDIFGCAAQRLGIEIVKIRGQRRYHRRAQYVADVEHDIVGPPMLGKCVQLVLQIFGLLTGEARYRIIAVKALGRDAVANFAIGELGRDLLLGNRRLGVLSAARPRKSDREDGGLQNQMRADDLHVSGSGLAPLTDRTTTCESSIP